MTAVLWLHEITPFNCITRCGWNVILANFWFRLAGNEILKLFRNSSVLTQLGLVFAIHKISVMLLSGTTLEKHWEKKIMNGRVKYGRTPAWEHQWLPPAERGADCAAVQHCSAAQSTFQWADSYRSVIERTKPRPAPCTLELVSNRWLRTGNDGQSRLPQNHSVFPWKKNRIVLPGPLSR